MRTVFLLHAVAAVAAAVALPADPSPTTTKCNQDNCYRQVKATAFPSRSTAADCSSFQTTTVYSSTSTTFLLPTVAPAKRDIDHALVARAATIPAYASNCQNSAAFASACSCALGSTAKAVTTVSVTTALCSTIKIQATAGVNAGKYFVGAPDSPVRFSSAGDAAAGTLFVVGADKTIDLAATSGQTFLGGDNQPLPLYNYGDYNNLIYQRLTCNILADGSLSCTTPGTGNSFQYCPRLFSERPLNFGPVSSDCDEVFVPKAIAACA